MRHYEIVCIVHPDQSENISKIIEHLKKIVTGDKGIIHRLEDWGRRQLSYPIKKLHKAHYILINVEVSESAINEFETYFRYNDVILRNIILRVKNNVSEVSPIMKSKDEKQEKK